MSKRKAQVVSSDDAVSNISNWFENPDNDENFELGTKRFSDDSMKVMKKETTSNLNRKKK